MTTLHYLKTSILVETFVEGNKWVGFCRPLGKKVYAESPDQAVSMIKDWFQDRQRASEDERRAEIAKPKAETEEPTAPLETEVDRILDNDKTAGTAADNNDKNKKTRSRKPKTTGTA